MSQDEGAALSAVRTDREPDVTLLARAFIKACNRADADGLVVLAHEQVTFHPSTLGGAHRVYAGHEGLRQWVTHLAAGIPFQMRIGEIRPLGPDRFVVLCKVHFGQELVTDFAVIGSVRDGRILDARGYLSDEGMLMRLGLIPAT